jgi:hypothetical protein
VTDAANDSVPKSVMPKGVEHMLGQTIWDWLVEGAMILAATMLDYLAGIWDTATRRK